MVGDFVAVRARKGICVDMVKPRPPGRPRKEVAVEFVKVGMNPDLRAQVVAAAAADDRPVTSLIVKAIRKYLAELPPAATAPVVKKTA